MQTTLGTSALLGHIPTWVWVIFAALIVMGVLQSRDQFASAKRLIVLPVVWLVFGLWGIHSAFGLHAAPVLVWVLGLVASAALVLRSGWPGQARFDAGRRQFFVPGSWLPMGLMMTIFMGKFALGMSLAMRPALAQSAGAAVAFSAAFGLLGGVFLGRSQAILSRA